MTPRDWWTAADACMSSLSAWTGVLAMVFSGYAAYRLRHHDQRLRELARAAPPPTEFAERVASQRGRRSAHPVALAIALLPSGESIRGQVEAFLAGNDLAMPVEELCLPRIEGVGDLERLVQGLRERRRYLAASNATEVHLFLAGPVQAGTIAGAVLDNWIPVKLYHPTGNPPPDNYQYWMPLLKG